MPWRAAIMQEAVNFIGGFSNLPPDTVLMMEDMGYEQPLLKRVDTRRIQPLAQVEDLRMGARKRCAQALRTKYWGGSEHDRLMGRILSDFVASHASERAVGQGGSEELSDAVLDARRLVKLEQPMLLEKIDRTHQVLNTNKEQRYKRLNSLGVFDASVNEVRARTAFRVDLYTRLSKASLRGAGALMENPPSRDGTLASKIERLCQRVVQSIHDKPPPHSANVSTPGHQGGSRFGRRVHTSSTSLPEVNLGPADTLCTTAYSSMGHTSMGHTSVGHTSVGHSSMGHTNVGHSSMGHTNAGHGSMGHTNVGHSSMGHTNAGHTSVGHTSMGHTSMYQATQSVTHGRLSHPSTTNLSTKPIHAGSTQGCPKRGTARTPEKPSLPNITIDDLPAEVIRAHLELRDAAKQRAIQRYHSSVQQMREQLLLDEGIDPSDEEELEALIQDLRERAGFITSTSAQSSTEEAQLDLMELYPPNMDLTLLLQQVLDHLAEAEKGLPSINNLRESHARHESSEGYSSSTKGGAQSEGWSDEESDGPLSLVSGRTGPGREEALASSTDHSVSWASACDESCRPRVLSEERIAQLEQDIIMAAETDASLKPPVQSSTPKFSLSPSIFPGLHSLRSGYFTMGSTLSRAVTAPPITSQTLELAPLPAVSGQGVGSPLKVLEFRLGRIWDILHTPLSMRLDIVRRMVFIGAVNCKVCEVLDAYEVGAAAVMQREGILEMLLLVRTTMEDCMAAAQQSAARKAAVAQAEEEAAQEAMRGRSNNAEGRGRIRVQNDKAKRMQELVPERDELELYGMDPSLLKSALRIAIPTMADDLEDATSLCRDADEQLQELGEQLTFHGKEYPGPDAINETDLEEFVLLVLSQQRQLLTQFSRFVAHLVQQQQRQLQSRASSVHLRG